MHIITNNQTGEVKFFTTSQSADTFIDNDKLSNAYFNDQDNYSEWVYAGEIMITQQ